MNESLERVKKGAALLVEIAETIKQEVENLTTADLFEAVRYFNELRAAHGDFQETKKVLDFTHDRLSRDIIPELVRSHAEKTGVKPPYIVEGVGRVTVAHRFSCSMIDKDDGIVWLKSHGHEALVQETVNSSTLSAFAKNLIQEEGKELPDDLFKVSTSPYTSITKIK